MAQEQPALLTLACTGTTTVFRRSKAYQMDMEAPLRATIGQPWAALSTLADFIGMAQYRGSLAEQNPSFHTNLSLSGKPVSTLGSVVAISQHLPQTAIRKAPGFGDKWLRYATPPALKAEIISFDRGGGFYPGAFRTAGAFGLIFSQCLDRLAAAFSGLIGASVMPGD